MASWMLDRIIPPQATRALWGALLGATAVYLGAAGRLPAEAGGWRKLGKGAGLVMLVYGALLLVGAASGGHDVLQPLRGSHFASTGAAQPEAGLHFARVKGVTGRGRELKSAPAAG